MMDGSKFCMNMGPIGDWIVPITEIWMQVSNVHFSCYNKINKRCLKLYKG